MSQIDPAELKNAIQKITEYVTQPAFLTLVNELRNSDKNDRDAIVKQLVENPEEQKKRGIKISEGFEITSRIFSPGIMSPKTIRAEEIGAKGVCYTHHLSNCDSITVGLP